MWHRRRRQREDDLDKEIAAHLTLEAQLRIEAGESPDEAARAARREFGSIAFAKDATRDAWGHAARDAVLQDLRHAVRLMRRAPGFTLIALLTLAFGIGASTALFTVVDAALLQPLPFVDADRLVWIASIRNGQSIGAPSPLDLRDMASAVTTLEGPIGYDHWRKNVSFSGHDAAEMVVGLVPARYFETLRVTPILGRLFTPDEEIAGRHFVAAISARVWRTRFDGDPRVIGRTLRINGETYTIVAVMPDLVPAWMDHTNVPVGIWTPFALANVFTEAERGAHGYESLARLKPGVTIDQARAELMMIAARLADAHPIDRGLSVDVVPLADTRAGPMRPLLLTLGGAVAMVLLITCANLAGLLLARNSARSRELAVRAALGAGRVRLLRQLLLETMVLVLAGGLAGVGVAALAGRALTRTALADPQPYGSMSSALPQLWSSGLDWRVLAFACAVSIVTALLCGLMPAFASTRGLLVDALKDGGRGGTAGPSRQRARRLLVTAEVGLSLVLVIAAALLVQTMIRLQRQDPGFPTDRLLLGHLYVPEAGYPDSEAIARFCDILAARLRALPGVREATITTGFPPVMGWRQVFTVPGLPIARVEDVPVTRFAAVDAHYLHALGLTLLRGRNFSETDTSASVPVAIVNETFARRYFPGQDPIGRTIDPGPPPGIPVIPLQDFGGLRRPVTIVGVIRDFMNDGLTQPPAPQLFMLFRQVPGLNFGFKDLAVRTEGDAPDQILPSVTRVLQALDAEIPLGEIQSMDARLRRQTADTQVVTGLLALFAGLGIALAAMGTYGVVSYLVAQRTHELGVRIALGAGTGDILWLVLRYGVSIGMVGVTAGVAGAFAVRQALAGLLFGVTASDPVTFASGAGGLLLVIILASAVPAMRARRINPVEALRGR